MINANAITSLSTAFELNMGWWSLKLFQILLRKFTISLYPTQHLVGDFSKEKNDWWFRLWILHTILVYAEKADDILYALLKYKMKEKHLIELDTGIVSFVL